MNLNIYQKRTSEKRIFGIQKSFWVGHFRLRTLRNTYFVLKKYFISERKDHFLRCWFSSVLAYKGTRKVEFRVKFEFLRLILETRLDILDFFEFTYSIYLLNNFSVIFSFIQKLYCWNISYKIRNLYSLLIPY